MITYKIGKKSIKIASWSEKSHLVDTILHEITSIEHKMRGNLWQWFINGTKIKSTKYVQVICPKCGNGLFSINLNRLRFCIIGSESISFICRSCSAKENSKKVNMEKRAEVRRINWNKKSEKEKKRFGESISDGKLHRTISEESKKEAARLYMHEKRTIREVAAYLGIKNLLTTTRILIANGCEIRSAGEGISLYLKANPGKNPALSAEARAKISKWNIENYIPRGKNKSKPEHDFFRAIQKDYPDALHRHNIKNKEYDVYIPSLDLYIEFDGTYYHGKRRSNFDLNQMYNMLNDVAKNNLVIESKSSLIRIWDGTAYISMEDLYKSAYYIIDHGIIRRDYEPFSPEIMRLEYFNKIRKKYPDDTDINLDIITAFVQAFYPMPMHESQDSFESIINKIRNTDDIFTSRLTTGSSFLKCRFPSYYKSKKGSKISYYDGYHDFEILRSIISNRLGISYKESWDLRTDTILRGFSSNYYLVSFFSPALAYNILKKISKPSDTVLDMSCGFGGRLFGWYAFQNGGKYIGYEPNPETYSELQSLADALDGDISIFNKPFEKCARHHVDVAFSCPPYYNVETYSHPKDQSANGKSFDEWINRFMMPSIDTMLSMTNRVYLVVNNRILKALANRVKVVSNITNTGSHFTQKSNQEYLVQIIK